MYVALLANRPGRNQDSLNFHIKSSSISWSGVFLSFCCWCERAVSQLSSPWSLTPLTVITLFQVFSAVTELQSKNGGERGVQHTFMASVWSMWAHYDHQFGTTKRKKTHWNDGKECVTRLECLSGLLWSFCWKILCYLLHLWCKQAGEKVTFVYCWSLSIRVALMTMCL